MLKNQCCKIVVPAAIDLTFGKKRSYLGLPFRIALRDVEVLRGLQLFAGEQIVAAVRLVLDRKLQQLGIHIRKIRDGGYGLFSDVVLAEQ